MQSLKIRNNHYLRTFSFIRPASRARFLNFFEKKDTYIDPQKKKIRRSDLGLYLVPGLVALSFIFLFKIWWGAEEICKKQYETLQKQDASNYRMVFENKERKPIEIPEEYRSEYVERQKRRMTKVLKEKKNEAATNL